ncbi:angiopoietin-related protein 7-like [Calliphora vicina]|uniref:angiopoietin-related protein 7-like n=1 Tax=Calliphora vicina TaxID=7373 RepID=UPI00325B3CC3
MLYKSLLYFLSLFYIWNSHNFAQAEIQTKYSLASDEFLTCDYSRFESQLEALKTGIDFLKLHFEMMKLELNKQKEISQGLQKNVDKIPQSIQSMENKILWIYREKFRELGDLISKQNTMIQTRIQEPPNDDKWLMVSDIKEIVKDHDSLLETFSEKIKNVENILIKATWETQMQQLSDNIARNLTLLQNIDKKLTNIETITATKTDQIAYNRNIQKYINRNEASKICLKDADQKLICTTQTYPTNCADFNANYCANNKCRIYNKLYGQESFLAACDDHNEGGGWTVIQRRINGSVDFYRGWSEYKDGFGNIDGEFFMGLDKLHALTTTLQPMELMIQLQDFNDTLKYAKYDEFAVGNETENYKLIKVGKYSGNAGDSFSYHQGFNFSTKDRDNDEDSTNNCAEDKKGAWWYKSCMWSNLNGKYYNIPEPPKGERGICWSDFNGYGYSMKFVQMMIRPKRI